MKEITADEYDNWIRGSQLIEDEHPVFTSCCGPHEFSMTILKNGKVYKMLHGFGPEKDNSPDRQYEYKTVYWWGIKQVS